ncbi:HipA family kinase [Kineococcus rhizosphaerae]|uniref:HipA family kinase n=1 Tax=Kineococcus rhizosphaerae TaxID=559628 RepID=UPI001FEAECD7|nr:HipA family kinase [Kineococcus rhizosphaerae]
MPPPKPPAALRRVTATRYVVPLREGGSMPGVCEADDLGTYVVKFHGAGQGRRVLVAEVLAAALAGALGLEVPELVVADVDPVIGRGEPDEEVQDLLLRSPGANLGMDFLPGALSFDPAVDPVDPDWAARVLWFDAFVLNVDRSWRNPNSLWWGARPWLIDHGAALYFHHDWPRAAASVDRPLRHAEDHLLLRAAAPVAALDCAAALTPEVLRAAVDAVPDVWVEDEPGFDSAAALRTAYLDWFTARLAATGWVEDLARVQREHGGGASRG